MGKTVLLQLIAILFLTFQSNAEGFNLELNLKSASGGQVLLAHYYGGSILVNDTVDVNSGGVAIIKRDTLLPQGIYKIYMNQDKHFDFLLGADQSLKITSPDFSMANLQIEGAAESSEFLQYLRFLGYQQKAKKTLEDKKVNTSGGEQAAIDKELEALNIKVTDYWKQKSKEYPGSFLAAFLMSNYTEELKTEDIPEVYTTNDSLKWIYQYNYRKNHYFDHFDLTDERLLLTPSIKPKLDTYFERVLLQRYDSVKPAAYQILKKIEPYPRMFRYVTSMLLNNSLNSKVMGMDALFVDIAKDYYLSGKATWADSATLAKVRENVIFMENNLIGKNARDFQMETIDGGPFRLYQNRSKYTILVFYEPDCSHCREYVPELYNDVYLPLRDKGLDVVAVYMMDKKNEWAEFVEKHQITDWHNVWDEHHVTRFKITYDTRTTPAVYLLDQDKKIIAKKVTIEFLKNYLNHFLGS